MVSSPNCASSRWQRGSCEHPPSELLASQSLGLQPFIAIPFLYTTQNSFFWKYDYKRNGLKFTQTLNSDYSFVKHGTLIAINREEGQECTTVDVEVYCSRLTPGFCPVSGPNHWQVRTWAGVDQVATRAENENGNTKKGTSSGNDWHVTGLEEVLRALVKLSILFLFQ